MYLNKRPAAVVGNSPIFSGLTSVLNAAPGVKKVQITERGSMSEVRVGLIGAASLWY